MGKSVTSTLSYETWCLKIFSTPKKGTEAAGEAGRGEDTRVGVPMVVVMDGERNKRACVRPCLPLSYC